MKSYRYETEEKDISQRSIQFFRQNNKVGKTCFSAHIHSAIEILFIRSGTFRVLAEDSEYIVQAGDTVLFRSNTVHYAFAIHGEECTYYVLKIKPSYLYDISFHEHGSQYLLNLVLNRSGKKIVWSKQEAQECGILSAAEQLICESEHPSYGSDIAMKIHAAAVLLALLRTMSEEVPSAESDNTVRSICDAMLYINEHYSENITARECAERFYMSYSYFSRAFQRVTGKSFRTYLNAVRIDHAERNLLCSDQSITEIASACGFNNVAYFISVFHSLKGTTPLAFRKQEKPSCEKSAELS